MLAESVSSVLSSFKRSPTMVYLKKMFNREISCHLKRRLKRLRYYKWKAWYTLLSSSGLKKFAYFYHSPPAILLRGAPLNIAIGHQVLCSNKGTNWKLIYPWRKINWHVLPIAMAHFSYSIWLMISGKSIILR